MTSIRRAGAASGAALSGLALALGVAHGLAPAWSRSAGLDVWNFPAARREAREIDERRRELEAVRDGLRREREFAEHVAGRIIAGRLTLRGAVEELAPSLRRRAGFVTTFECSYQAPTFRHGVARYAIAHVERALGDEPDRWAVLAPRLEAEYAALE